MYPTDHVFIFFRIFIFLQIFLINISMKPEETQTNYLYTWRTIECFHNIGPHADGIGPALGRQLVLQVCPPCPDYETPIIRLLAATALILLSDTGNMSWKVLNIADLFCLHGNIRPGNTTISLFFSASKLFFDFFVFLAKISRLYSFIWIKFSKLTTLKMSHPKGSR